MGPAKDWIVNLKTALKLGRVSNLPTVWTNVLAGAALAGVAYGAGGLAALLVSMSLFYTAGMFLNDAFDKKFDAAHAPQRPIPSGEARAAEVFTAGFLMLAAALGALFLASRLANGNAIPAMIAGAGLAAIIVLYDRHHKKNPAAPALMGLTRALVYVAAALAISGTLPFRAALGAVSLMSYVAGITYLSARGPLPLKAGLRPVFLILVPVVYLIPVMKGGGLGLITSLAFAAWAAYSLSWILGKSKRNPDKGVAGLICGISLFDASVIAGQNSPVAAVAAVAFFFLCLLGQRHIRGT